MALRPSDAVRAFTSPRQQQENHRGHPAQRPSPILRPHNRSCILGSVKVYPVRVPKRQDRLTSRKTGGLCGVQRCSRARSLSAAARGARLTSGRRWKGTAGIGVMLGVIRHVPGQRAHRGVGVGGARVLQHVRRQTDRAHAPPSGRAARRAGRARPGRPSRPAPPCCPAATEPMRTSAQSARTIRASRITARRWRSSL